MEKIKYKNRFRILDTNGKALYLNSIVNVKGNYQYVQGFDTLAEAQQTRQLWARMRGKSEELFKIERYSETIPHLVKKVSEQADTIIRKKLHLFSGKGLKENTLTAPKEENKYKPDSFYGREAWMYQSLERKKGKPVIHKQGTPITSGNDIDVSKTLITDIETFERIRNSVNDGAINLSFNLIESLRKHNFANRKELKTYLKGKKFTNRQINAIIPKYYYS